MATKNKELARQLLLANPLLPKALFQVIVVETFYLRFCNYFCLPSNLEDDESHESASFMPFDYFEVQI